jgi:site-specific DNA-methyltransferase (adenine-specific)
MDYLKPTKNIFVWDKMNGDNFLNDCELAYNTCKGNNTIYKHAYIGKYHLEPKRIHPTQKPTKLYDFILNRYANKKDKILDTHLGSGSSAIASYYFNVSEFVGIEINKDYYTDSVKRIKEKTQQKRLF